LESGGFIRPEDVNDKWLAGGSARRVSLAVATKGAHGGVQGDYKFVVNQARLAIGDLAKLVT
jgi:hypothetical protein